MEKPVDLGPLLGRAAHLVRERLEPRLTHIGLTPVQTHVLLYLQRSGGGAWQREVVGHLRVKPSTANGILDRMEEKALVVRSVSQQDARQRYITLTEKGRCLYDQACRAFQEMEDLLVRGMDEEEQIQFRTLLQGVIGRLEEDRTV